MQTERPVAPTRAEVVQKLQTAHPELFRRRAPSDDDDDDDEFYDFDDFNVNARVVEDVVAIVCDRRRYSPRGSTEEYRIPEDISTGIAKTCFGVDAYSRAG